MITKRDKLFVELVSEIIRSEKMTGKTLIPYSLMHKAIKEKDKIEYERYKNTCKDV